MKQILEKLQKIESRLSILEDKVENIESNSNKKKTHNIINLEKKDTYIKYLNEPNFNKLLKKKTYMGAAKIYQYIYHKEDYTSPLQLCKNEIVLYYNNEWIVTTTQDIVKIILFNIKKLYININNKLKDIKEFTENQEYIIKMSDKNFIKKFTSYLIKLEKNRLILLHK